MSPGWLSRLSWQGVSADYRAWALVVSMSFVMAVGGVAFKMGFRSLGSLTLTPASLVGWLINPWIIAGLGCGVGARLLYYAALGYMSLSEITLLTALSMVMTVALAYLIFGESLSPRETVGAVLVLTGVVLIEG